MVPNASSMRSDVALTRDRLCEGVDVGTQKTDRRTADLRGALLDEEFLSDEFALAKARECQRHSQVLQVFSVFQSVKSQSSRRHALATGFEVACGFAPEITWTSTS